MEKQFIYLINNKSFSSDSEMPKHINFYLGKDQSFTKPYDDAYNNWKSSLTELTCDKDQIFKIRQSIYYSNKEHQGYKFEDFIKNPTDITSISEVRVDKCCNWQDVNGECQFPNCNTKGKLYFKEPDSSHISSDIMIKENDKIDIQVLSGEIVRICLDTPKLFDACSLVESKIQEYSNQESKANYDEIEGFKKHIEEYKELSTLKELRIVELEEYIKDYLNNDNLMVKHLEERNEKLKLELQDYDKQLSEKQKHIDYAEKVSYQTSCDNAKLIGTVTELKEKFNKIEYEHSNQSDLIKKNTNYIKTLESELSDADNENAELKDKLSEKDKEIEELELKIYHYENADE